MNLQGRLEELDRLLQYIDNEDKKVVHEYHIKARLYIQSALSTNYRRKIHDGCDELEAVCTWIQRFLSVFTCLPDSEEGKNYRETLGKDWKAILLRDRAKNLREAIDLYLKMYC